MPENKKADIPALNIDMVRAGVDAFKRWDSARDPEDLMVADVFYSMLKQIEPPFSWSRFSKS